jgi:protein TonB
MKMLKNSGLAIGIAVSLCIHGLFFLYANKKAMPVEEHSVKYTVTLFHETIRPASAEKTEAQNKEGILQPQKEEKEYVPEKQKQIETKPEIKVEKKEMPALLPEDVKEEEAKPEETFFSDERMEQKKEQEDAQIPYLRERETGHTAETKTAVEELSAREIADEGLIALAVTEETEKIEEPPSGGESTPHGAPEEIPQASSPGQQRRAREEIPDLSHVFDGLREKIVQKRVYPPVARKRGYEGTVVVLVTLDTVGNLSALVVSRSSGHKVLDKAAVELIKKVLPYEHNTGKTVSVEIPISYELVE